MIVHLIMRALEKIMDFNLFKAFGYIERVGRSDFFLGKDLYFLLHMCAKGSELLSYISTLIAPCFPAQNINSTHGSIVDGFSLN